TPAVAAPPKHEPTNARLLERANVRWAAIMKADWVSVHDLLTPELKHDAPLAQYLAQTQFHTYQNAKVAEVLAIEKDMGYVRSSSLWTPTHPDLARVKLDPGQTLTQELKVIETWRWVGGDWCYSKMELETEFFQQHPEFLKVASTTNTDDASKK